MILPFCFFIFGCFRLFWRFANARAPYTSRHLLPIRRLANAANECRSASCLAPSHVNALRRGQKARIIYPAGFSTLTRILALTLPLSVHLRLAFFECRKTCQSAGTGKSCFNRTIRFNLRLATGHMDSSSHNASSKARSRISLRACTRVAPIGHGGACPPVV